MCLKTKLYAKFGRIYYQLNALSIQKDDIITVLPFIFVVSPIAAEVSVEEIEAVKIPDIAIPVVIQNTAKILPPKERGDLSPYLGKNKP